MKIHCVSVKNISLNHVTLLPNSNALLAAGDGLKYKSTDAQFFWYTGPYARLSNKITDFLQAATASLIEGNGSLDYAS